MGNQEEIEKENLSKEQLLDYKKLTKDSSFNFKFLIFQVNSSDIKEAFFLIF
jgi:hypothetical protein